MKLERKDSYNYFDEFAKNVGYSLECAKKIAQALNSYDKSKMDTILNEIHEIEHLGDIGQHDMLNHLIKDFLPPIEREDIISLAKTIDNLIDLIEEILINIDIFDLNTIRPEAINFSNLLIKCCENENNLIEHFKNFRKIEEIKNIVIEINALEEQGDKLYKDTMRALYRDNTNIIEIIKWTTIYNCFEDSIDLCENLADEIESIVLKNI